MIGGKNVFCMILLEFFGILERFLLNDLPILKFTDKDNFEKTRRQFDKTFSTKLVLKRNKLDNYGK